MLKIIVLTKQAVDITQVKFDADGKGYIEGAGGEINPFDLNALELGVHIKDKMEATVTTMSMGKPGTEAILKDTIARGANAAILLEDAAFNNSDTLATAYTLSAAIKKLGEFDLIICGEKSVDSDTGQVGPAIAEFLNIPHLSYVSNLEEISDSKMVLTTDMDGEQFTISCGFPILLTVTKNINVPRLPSMRDKLNSRKAQIPVWHANDLSTVAESNRFGEQGSAITVDKILLPAEGGRKGKVYKGEADDIVKELVNDLDQDGVLKGIGAK